MFQKLRSPELIGAAVLAFTISPLAAANSDGDTVDWSVSGPRLERDAKVEKQIDDLMSTMTLEQKVAQMIQPEIGFLTVEQMRTYGFGSYLNGGNSAPYGNKQADPQTWLKYADEMYIASVDASLDGSSIPTIWGTDAMHGHSNVFGATLFPHNIGLGAARDPLLIEKIGEATAKEVSATGIEWSFAPTVAVVQDDRWGRTYESYSEDPAVVASYAGKMVAGIQGHKDEDFLRNSHRIATAKHFIGDGGTQNGIDRGNTVIDEKTLRDIHAAGYFSAIEAGVQSVMASFNSWNGKRVHGHKYLLTDVLKDQMGFDGFVVSDWNAHKFVEGCDLEQCAGAINAGVDVLMVPEHFEAFYHNTVKQVKEGVIPVSRIDDAVRRFLRAKIRWGVLSRGKPSSRPESTHPEWLNASQHKELAREAVRKSLVMLKNNGGVLPISPKSNVLVAGDAANDIAKQAGGWSVSWQGTDNTNEDFPNATSVFAGLREQITAAGGTVELSEDGRYSEKPDVAIVVIGEAPYAEWFGDIQRLEYQYGDKQDLQLLRRLKKENIPVVTVFISGRPLWVNKELNASDAFVAAWLPGSEGQGVADVLLTDEQDNIQYDFTGKLSFSWPKYDDQFTLNNGDKPYDPLFAYGYGLTYQDDVTVGKLQENTSPEPKLNDDQAKPLFVRNLSEGLVWKLVDPTGEKEFAVSSSGVSGDGESLSMQSVNLAYQEDGRKFVWAPNGKPAAVALSYSSSAKPAAERKNKFLQMRVRIDELKPAPDATIKIMCSASSCLNSVSTAALAASLSPGEWQNVAIPLNCATTPASPEPISDALRISAEKPFSVALADIAIVNSIASDAATFTCGD
ncbi:glycoside hydrolase family 3 protein [Alteromonas pelagimontana]|uniref:Glycoside hydrolase family 3 protein n=1 Tax=Alteromonas pelagimontana TaxID=1858656 RepID=A0A6M4MDN6_9ALTE|nr:glycoside hydrolase family 3 N-terminal domain-containing protein [Alteromonas pelagimontana]QJR80740.1 glycoside hydrolase family 3 protein [Alteromonas pelagimontana]